MEVGKQTSILNCTSRDGIVPMVERLYFSKSMSRSEGTSDGKDHINTRLLLVKLLIEVVVELLVVFLFLEFFFRERCDSSSEKLLSSLSSEEEESSERPANARLILFVLPLVLLEVLNWLL